MAKFGQSYAPQGSRSIAFVPCQDAAGEAASTRGVTSSPTCSPLSTTLSRIRLMSCSAQPRSSTEVVPLTSLIPCDESLCYIDHSTDCNYKLSHDETSYVDGAPCKCSAAARIACNDAGMEDHAAACLEQLLHNPSLQDRTWTMSGSTVLHPSPLELSGGQCFSMACGSAGGDITVMLTHGSTVFTAHKDHHIRVWKLSASSSCRLKLLNTLPTVRDCFLNCFCERNYVQVRRHHRCLWIQHADSISALAVGSDAYTGKNDESEVQPELLYSASWDKTFKVWRLSDYKCMESVVAHTDAITAIVIGYCSSAAVHRQLLYTASCDGTVKAWSKEPVIKTSRTFLKRRTMKIRHRLVATLPDHKCAVNALAISRDGMILFSAGSDGMIRMWRRYITHGTAEAAAHMTLCSTVEGHKRAVLCLSIAGDDQVLLSGSADKTVRAWRIGRLKGKVSYRDGTEAGALLTTSLEGHRAPIKWVCGWPCVHGSGYTIYIGALDTSIKVWWLQAPNSDLRLH